MGRNVPFYKFLAIISLSIPEVQFCINHQKFCYAGNLPTVLGKRNFYSGARQMFRESRICLQTIHYIHATKGVITGMIAHAMVILSIQVAMVGVPVKISTGLGGKRYSDEIGLPIQYSRRSIDRSCLGLCEP